MVEDALDLMGLTHRLGGVAETFAENELAYLAVTSKVELPLRDRLAWSLHCAVWPKFFVAREWRRTDLAVLEPSGQPVVLLEAKAMYAFDGCSERTWAKYLSYLRSDHEKARALAGDRASVFLLLLVSDIEGDITTAPPDVIKYRGALARARRRLSEVGAIRAACAEHVKPQLEELGRVVGGSLDAGQAFGLTVSLDYWLVGV